ncbi:hypothetical protein MMC14_004916 [Varicellaria rhodocarpa]|nr:hypothetical protein [Varicellaria rhodocarpa]
MNNSQGFNIYNTGVDEGAEDIYVSNNTATPIDIDVTPPFISATMPLLNSDEQMQVDTVPDLDGWNASSLMLDSQETDQTLNSRSMVSLLPQSGYSHQPRDNSQVAYSPTSGNTVAPNNRTLNRWADVMATEDTDEGQRITHSQKDVCDFFAKWAFQYKWESHRNKARGGNAKINECAVYLRDAHRPERVTILDLKGDHYDVQGINWQELQASRSEARYIRNHSYVGFNTSTTFQTASALRCGKLRLPCDDTDYRFRQLMTRCQPRFYHRELRNILAAPSRNSIFYASASRIDCFDPSFDTIGCVADFANSPARGVFPLPLGISVLAADNGVLVVGACSGEYAFKPLDSNNDGIFTIGITGNEGLHRNLRLVNHIHTFLDRRSGLPQAVFSSNDSVTRVLDCYTNTFVQENRTDWAVNCSATNPDGRLRLLVGDNNEPMVAEAETGREIAQLSAHLDHGFACDWAPDGIHMATGHEDGMVAIWDARYWSRPYQIFETEIGGARSLRFSPLGGGRRALLVAEPADIVSVVDAVTFESRQRFDFFGDIGGAAFAPDGSSFFVSITDDVFGGVMEFERAGSRYGSGVLRQERLVNVGQNIEKRIVETYHDWICEDEMDDEDRMLVESRRRYRSWDSAHEVY